MLASKISKLSWIKTDDSYTVIERIPSDDKGAFKGKIIKIKY